MRRGRIFLLLGIALAGCGDTLGPRDFAGTYALSTVFSSSPLPVTVYAGSQGHPPVVVTRIEVIADTLELRRDGTWEQRTVQRGTTNETTNPEVTVETSTGRGTFSVGDEGTLTFAATISETSCAFFCGLQMKAPTTVLVAGGTLRFQDVEFGGIDWQPAYVRVQ